MTLRHGTAKVRLEDKEAFITWTMGFIEDEPSTEMIIRCLHSSIKAEHPYWPDHVEYEIGRVN